MNSTVAHILASLGFTLLANIAVAAEDTSTSYWVCVSNERSGDVTILHGPSGQLVATVPVGKRPRGIHASPDGRLLYVALSGSPIQGPPKLDAQGNPIFEEDNEEEADHSADGIGVVDLMELKFVKKLPAGSDPEEFAISKDGQNIYISNEDVATASVLDVESERIEHIIRVKKEPEGVALNHSGSQVYVTCETAGEIVVIDTTTNKAIAEFIVGGRPRTAAFSPDDSRAFIPSETAARVNVVDTSKFQVIGKIELPAGSRPMGTAINRDGTRLYVSNGRGGTVAVVDPRAAKVLQMIAVGKRPWGIALSPDEKYLYVANGPSNDVSVVDVGSAKEIKRIPAGESPWGIAIVAAPAVATRQ